jgi:hypothetical protein
VPRNPCRFPPEGPGWSRPALSPDLDRSSAEGLFAAYSLRETPISVEREWWIHRQNECWPGVAVWSEKVCLVIAWGSCLAAVLVSHRFALRLQKRRAKAPVQLLSLRNLAIKSPPDSADKLAT